MNLHSSWWNIIWSNYLESRSNCFGRVISIWSASKEGCMIFTLSRHQLLFTYPWIPWNLSFRYILFHEKRLQTMLWHHNVRVNSHQRWKQTRFRVCFHLWCELTLALWCHSIVWSLFLWNKLQRNDKFHGIHG